MDISGWLLPKRRTPEKRLQRVLRAAVRDRYYMGLVSPVPTPVLDCFPYSSPGDWTRCRPVPDLPGTIGHPLNPNVVAASPGAGRTNYTAIMASKLVLLDRAREFARYRPEVEFAVLVAERPGEEELTEPERDLLWDAFQVPVYRLLLGFDGTLLAHECEALGGLHATGDAIFEEYGGAVYVTSLTDTRHPSIRLRTGLSGRLADSPCDCGRHGLRLSPAWRGVEEMSSAAN
jgi:hypothetical protein